MDITKYILEMCEATDISIEFSSNPAIDGYSIVAVKDGARVSYNFPKTDPHFLDDESRPYYFEAIIKYLVNMIKSKNN